MFRQDIVSTFSDLWYQVADTRPRLSPHAQIVRQQYGPLTTFIVEEPAGSQFYRLSSSAYIFVAMLDGSRTVGEAWDACNAQLGDAAPTQRECIDSLAKLQSAGLLLGDLPLASDLVLERKKQARKRKHDRRTGKYLFYNVPLLNPEPFLERHRAFCRLAFSKASLVLWTLLVLVAGAMVFEQWPAFTGRLNTAAMLDPVNLTILGLVFFALRAIHEFGHAVSCKAFGGRVTEIGVIMIAGLLPLPYCDASSSWRFPLTRHRVVVSLGGILAETFIAACAAIIWATTDAARAPTLALVCHNIVIISGLTTLLFNLNPLLRYDGYYILSDLAGSPNMAQRANQIWKAILHRYIFGVRTAVAPFVRDRGEATLLIVYGALSLPYRLFILAAIVLLVMSQYPTVGVVIGTILILVFAVWPVFKGIGFLASDPSLAGRRGRAVAVTLGAIAGVGAFLVFVPMPASASAPAVITTEVTAPVRTGESGFVRAVRVGPGEAVAAGATILELENPDAVAELEIARARVQGALAHRAKASVESPGERQLAERDLAVAEAELARAEERVASLIVAAPADGRVVPVSAKRPTLDMDLGRYLERGAMVASVISTDRPLVRVSIADKDAAAVFRSYGLVTDAPASVKFRGLMHRTFPARVVRTVDAGTRDLTDPGLSAGAGGNVMLDPDDETGRRTLEPQFVIDLAIDEPITGLQPGVRAHARIDLPPEPLAFQWYRKARQYLKSRLG